MSNQEWLDILVPFLERWEGLETDAYQCSAYVWTIGLGTTVYPDGTRVEPGDVCTVEEAYLYCMVDLRERSAAVLPLINSDKWRSGAKFAMLMSLSYNIGVNALSSSTVLKRINTGASDGDIKEAWSWWCKAGGKTVQGLVNRRAAELETAYS